MIMTKYSDISPRTAGRASARFLSRITHAQVLGRFGQVHKQPMKGTKTVIWRRYNKLAVATSPLVEGVTPTGKQLTHTDIQTTLKQYGDFTIITDVVRDTHEDPVLREAMEILGDQSDETIETLRAGVLIAGTNVQYSNGTSRSAVNTAIADADIKNAVRTLKRQAAKKITRMIKAGTGVGTAPIQASFIGLCHSDVQYDLENLTGWKGVHEYGMNVTPLPDEIGGVFEVRFIQANFLTPWADAGGAKGTMISTTGTSADVYPILFVAKDAYGIVPLSGKESVSVYVNNPKATDSDPLAQRGTIGWKTYNATKILQDLWMVRHETGVTA